MSIPRWLQNRKIQAVIIMVLTLVLLLATEPQIGLTWDEPIYMRASEIYTSWFGKLITQPAEALSKDGIDESWSFNHEHPPLDKIWSGIVWSGARFVFNDQTAHRLGNMILVSVMAGLLYLMIAEAYGLAAGLAAAAALLSLPRFFFHAHVAALDMPATCAIVFVTFLFWKTRDDLSWKWTLLLGLVWGLAFATKVNAIFLPAILFLWALLFRRRLMLLVRIVVMPLIGIPFSFAIWPWLYPDIPARVMDYLGFVTVEHWKIGQWYLGKLYMPPPWHFPFVMAWAVVPLTLTVLYWIGIVRAGLKWREADSLGGLLFLNALVPILALTTGKSMAYDNERLLMHVFPFLAGLAGMGFGWLVIGIQQAADRMQKPRWAVPVTVLAVLLAFLPQSISLVRLYPHLLSYYSETVGGIPGAARLGLETTYWCETYAAALPYLNEHAKPGDMIWVDPLSQSVMIYYQVHGRLRSDVKIAHSPVAPMWPFVYAEYGPPTPAIHSTSDFIVLQYRQTLMGSTPAHPDRHFYSAHPDSQWVSTHELLYQLSQDGVPIMEIYSSSPAQGFESELGQATVPVPADWQTFESEAGNFAVQVPPTLEFTESTQKVDLASVHIYDSFSEERGSYTVFYLDLPAESIADPNVSQGLLNSTRDGWLNIIQGTLMEERAVSMGDHPGGEAIVEANINDLPVKFKIRYTLVQNRYYQITVGIPQDRAFPAEMDAFLQSFALLKDL
ncbi:MAG: glycosyl transferase [Chloroflexi bacterium]|nr:MAG: glycosyl transferase [Chloroflexota bacterium]